MTTLQPIYNSAAGSACLARAKQLAHQTAPNCIIIIYAEKMSVWCCQICSAKFISLRELVSHVRGSHSGLPSHTYACQVSECDKVFKNTNTWYKHVLVKHKEEYCGDHESDSSSDHESASSMEHSEHSDHTHEFEYMHEGSGFEDVPFEPDNELEVSTLENDVTRKLLKLKEKHLLSHSAVYEVVDLVKFVCDGTIANAMSNIVHAGEALGLGSEFFEQLQSVQENVDDPMAKVSTTYRQQSYIAKNLPYVVCITIIM